MANLTDFQNYQLVYSQQLVAESPDASPLIPRVDLGLEFTRRVFVIQVSHPTPPQEWGSAGEIVQSVVNGLYQPLETDPKFIEIDRQKLAIGSLAIYLFPAKVEQFSLVFEPAAYVDYLELRIWQWMGDDKPFFSLNSAAEPPTLEQLGGVPSELLGQPLGVATLNAEGVLAEDQRPPVGASEPGTLPDAEAWQALPLLNNWNPVGTDYDNEYSQPRFRKVLGQVQLSGIIRNGGRSSGFTSIAQLPEGYRPLKRELMWMNCFNQLLRVDAFPDGTLKAFDIPSSEFIALIGQFPLG